MATLIVDATGAGGAYTTIQAAVSAATGGDTISIVDGNYSLGTSTLNIDKSLAIVGQSEAGVVLDASGVDGYGIFVTADNTSLSNFTLNGPAAGSPSGNYGLKAGPDTGAPSDLLNGLNISHVTVSNSGRAEFDLNGVINATLSDVTADGNGTAGTGFALTDCSNVTFHNIATIDNAWGSVALYPTNRFYVQQLTGVTFTGTYSANEAIKIYLEDASNGISGDGSNEVNGTSTNMGSLTLPASFANNHGYQVLLSSSPTTPVVAYFATEADADAFLAVLSPAQKATVALEGPSGSLIVKPGLSLQAAIDAASNGDTILVYPGAYTESANYNPSNNTNDPGFANPLGLLVNKSVTIQGVTAAGVAITDEAATEATITASVQSNWGTNFFVTADDVTIAGLTLKGVGSSGQPFVNKAIEVVAGGFTLKDSVVTAVDNLPIYSAVYINDESTTGANPATFVSDIDSYTITGNDLFSSLVVTNGAGWNAAGFSGVITNNTFLNTAWVDPVNNDDVNWPLLLTGTTAGTPWQNAPVATPTSVSGNVVDLGANTQILLRLRDENSSHLPSASFVAGYAKNNTLGTYAYALDSTGGLRTINVGSQTAATFYMVATIAGIMSFDNAYQYGDPDPLALAGDTVVVYSGAATENADVSINNLTFKVEAGSADLNLTLAAGIAKVKVADYSAGHGVDVDIMGNSVANTITGNPGKNVIDGGAGADTMAGGAGSDTYVVDVSGDRISEASGGGTDLVNAFASYTLSANIENLVLLGSAVAGIGNASSNHITGNALNNEIEGEGGRDFLFGGAGADDFNYDSIADTGRTASTRDVISDFEKGIDDIDLHLIDARVGSGNQAFKFIGTAGFTRAAGQVNYVLFNSSNDALDKTIVQGDVNGDGRADFQIELQGLIKLTAGDFIL